ncbi:MAG: hypothetical protein ACFFDN_34485 [Candidatus Hodarchaeota archaeon]
MMQSIKNNYQKSLIHDVDWDILIILDACRYDYFSRLYKDYFEGDLKKVTSPASETREWLRETFTDFYNLVYVSANPYINSKGLSFGGINAKYYFSKIIDVWDFGWDNELETVHPREVNKYVLESQKGIGKRIIAHYMQPHAPYLSFHIPDSWWKAIKLIKNHSNKIKFIKSRINAWYKWRINSARKYCRINMDFKNKTTNKSALRSHPYYMDVLLNVGENILNQVYEENLKIVLENVSMLIKKSFSNKTIIITSDHGELLGENNYYGHPSKIKHPVLNEVPWFRVQGIKVVK